MVHPCTAGALQRACSWQAGEEWYFQQRGRSSESFDDFDGKNNNENGAHTYHTDLIVESNEDMGVRDPDGKEIE